MILPRCEFKAIDIQIAEGQIQQGKCRNIGSEIVKERTKREVGKRKEKSVTSQGRDEKSIDGMKIKH